MKQNAFRVFAVFCLIMAVIGFAGCSKKEAGAASAEAADFGKRTDGINYWRVKFDEPVELRTVDREYTEDIAPGDDVANNEWTRGFSRDLNVNIKLDWVSPLAEYDTRLNLSIASGQLPDVFIVSNAQFQQLLDGDLVADITDYVENNLSDTVKEIMASDPTVTESAKRDGRLYALPKYGYGAIAQFHEMWIRRDWLKGRQMPQTVADFENLMQTFMNENPGAYGFASQSNLNQLMFFGQAFKAYPRTWLAAADGSIVFGGIQPEARVMLQTYADWYKKGYLRPDFTSLTADALREDIISGKVGVDVGFNWWGYQYAIDLVLNNGNDAYFESYEIPTVDGEPGICWAPFDNEGYIVVNKNYETIPAPLKCLSYVAFYALEAIQQKAMTMEELRPYLRDGNANQILRSFYVSDPRLEIVAFEQIQEAARTKSTAHFLTPNIATKYETGRSWAEDGDVQGVSAFTQTYGPRSGYATLVPIHYDGRFILDRMNGPIPQDVIMYGSLSGNAPLGTLNDIIVEGYTKIIVGEEPISYFDTIVAEWKAAGGDAYTAAINRDYGNK